MAAQLEEIFKRLLLPDTEILNQATRDLKLMFKNPQICEALCQLLCSSVNAQVRQYAAILLRRKVVKKRHWTRLNTDLRKGIKSSVLMSLEIESEKSVRQAVGQLAGSLAKHDLPRNMWPEFLQYLKTTITSSKPADRELGVYVLSIVAESSAVQLQPYLKHLLQMLGKCLQDRSSAAISFYTIRTLTALGCVVGSDELQIFQNLLPSVFQVIALLVPSDEDKACEALQIFDELIECEVSVLAPHIKSVVELCLHLGGDASLGNDIRVKAITLIGSLAHLKKKTLIKHKLISPILKVLFPIMCTHLESDDDQDEIPYAGVESSSPVTVSAQVIDVLALHLPPEKLFQPLMQYVEPALASQNPYERKAGYIALAVVAEGCADHIRNKYFKDFLQCLYKGILDPQLCVRNAALFALGQFAEHLQPEIGNYAEEILPLILENLKDKVYFSESKKELPSTTKLFYALENFCDCLGERLSPYLSSIVDQLFIAIEHGPIRVQELAISSLGVVADSVKEGILPYFERILNYLKTILSRPPSSDIMPVQLQALDTLGILARTVGTDRFLPFLDDSMKLGLRLLNDIDDPDLRRCTYGLFASLSTLIHEQMYQYLENIVAQVIRSLTSNEGVVVQTAGDKHGGVFPLFIDLSDDETEEGNDDAEIDLGVGDDLSDCSDDEDYEDDVEGVGLDIENSYLKEKEDTCSSIKEIVQNTRSSIWPFLNMLNDATNPLLEHPAGTVRGAAIEALVQYCCTYQEICLETNPPEAEVSRRREVVSKMGITLLLKLTLIIREDKDRTVAMTALEAINDLIKTLGHLLFTERNNINTVVAVVKDVLQFKMACQDHSDEDSVDDHSEDEQAEYDQMLLEYAGEIVPSLAKVVQPGSNFAPYFAGILSILVQKTKRKMSVAEKSFSVGILAESVAAMKEGISPFVSHLYPVFISLAQDEDEEVRSNAIFGLGVLVEFGGPAVSGYFSNILQLLSNTLSKETDPRVTDNICAAVCRMIITNTNSVPMDNVFPVLIRVLPLKQDFEENATIVRCMAHLLKTKHVEVFNHMPTILQILADVSHTPQINQGTQVIIDNFIKEVSNSCNSGFETVLQSLSSELADKLKFSVNTQTS